jgi:hypothetical protein
MAILNSGGGGAPRSMALSQEDDKMRLRLGTVSKTGYL